MNKKTIFALSGIYLFLFVLNYLHPMSFGDDYLYSFIWQGKPMFVPLDENAVRISSWHDLVVSQWSHYLSWSGRTVAHVLVQFFLWVGKDIFNIFNALAGVLLVAEIYWCINRGKIFLNLSLGTVYWIFFMLWAFTPGFSPVFFWLTASCNYLWTNILLLGFLLIYIKKYYFFYKKTEKKVASAIMMFFLGVLAGWTNENSACWVILVLFLYIYSYRKNKGMETWMYFGFGGLLLGYSLLVLAPGNMQRLLAEHGKDWTIVQALPDNIRMLAIVLFFQLLLWFFVLRTLYSLKKMTIKRRIIKKDILIVKVLCASAFGMSAIMLLSPFFPPRSGFPGTVMLIIASGILLRIQKETGIELIQDSARKLLLRVGIVYFVITSTVTLHHFYNSYIQIQNFMAFVEQHKNSDKGTIIVKQFPKSGRNEDVMSGLHILGLELSPNEGDWKNVAFARYYGIKGIRMLNDQEEAEDVDSR